MGRSAADDGGRPAKGDIGGGGEGRQAGALSNPGGARQAAAAGMGGAGADAQPQRRGRWADETPPCDRMQDDGGSAYADEDAGWNEEDMEDEDEFDGSNAWEDRPTEEDLKSRWLQACRAVRALEKMEKGDDEPSSALLAARNARDTAERAWRDMLTPKPVSLRLGYAQKKFDKAQRAVDKAMQELQQFEEDVDLRRGELREAVEAAERRRDTRQEELDALHQEAGDLAGGRGRTRDDGGGHRVSDMLAKELQALVELLEEGSEARGRANLLIAKVATVAARDEQSHYNIHTDGEDANEDEGADFQAVARRGRGPRRAEAEQAPSKGYTWDTNAHGRWSRQKGATGGGGCGAATNTANGNTGKGSTSADGSDMPRPGCAQEPSDGFPQPMAAAGARGRKNARGHDDVALNHPCWESHRGEDEVRDVSVEADGDDAARAAELKLEQDAAIAAAQKANATFGDEASMQIAGQLYARKVQQVVDRAKAAGVAPASDGKALIELTPHDLNEWVRSVLAPLEAEAAETKEL